MLVKLQLPLWQEPAHQRRVILVALDGVNQRVLNLLNCGADRQGQILARHRRLSETYRIVILLMVGPQLHADEFAAAISLIREPLDYRCKGLETQQFLYVDNLTGNRQELHNALSNLLAESAAQAVAAMIAKQVIQHDHRVDRPP